MFVRETTTTVYTCPSCGMELMTSDNGALRCGEHGMFFAYGPQLLVRAPQQDERFSDQPMPWEREHIDSADGR